MSTAKLNPAAPVLPKSLQGLLRPAAYPHPVAAVTVIETQLSWVLIAGERAYKIKRPVIFPFVDLRRLEDRRRLCHEELRLNRRFTPQLYLEVCPITAPEGEAHMGGEGPAIEYAVVMRTFDRREELDRLVLEQRVTAAELARFGQWLARVQEHLPIRRGGSSAGQPESVAAAVVRNARECADASAVFGAGERVRSLERLLLAETALRATALSWRAASGRIRECHADLHLSNVVRIGGELLPFDCLEFEPAFRWIDVAQDAAFFYADLLGYGEPRLATAFLNAYLGESGDYHACVVLPLYSADRALVRAKVLALQAGQAHAPPAGSELARRRHAHYLEVAEGALQASVPCCLMMTGLPGSGKSWLALQLAAELSAVVIRSDVERKRLAGLAPLAHSHSVPGSGLYTDAQSDVVYGRLEQGAAEVLSGRRNVIVDANYGRRRHREALSDLCELLAVPLFVVQCEAPDALLRQRLAARALSGHDPSEADERVLDMQASRWEPVAREERLQVIVADTARAAVLADVLQDYRRLRGTIAIDQR
jgi:aminoglycoside phosphotransferase family enzyme/predicted kinase